MKKMVKRFTVTLVVVLSIGTAYGATYSIVPANYDINVNGQKVAVQPYNLNGTTLLSIRAISDTLNVPIEWNNTTKSVEIETVDVDKLKESCIMIFAESANSGMQGSAICWDYGEYLTANHVIAEYRTNIHSSDSLELKIDKVDPEMDIATLTASNDVKPVKIGDSDDVKQGDKIIVISSPNGKVNTVTYGTVEQPTNSGMVIWADLDVGASGGGVFTLSGELIGIVVSGSGYDKAHLVIPINDIRKSF